MPKYKIIVTEWATDGELIGLGFFKSYDANQDIDFYLPITKDQTVYISKEIGDTTDRLLWYLGEDSTNSIARVICELYSYGVLKFKEET